MSGGSPAKLQSMVVSYQAVLLIAFGGPTSSEEIRPFLERVTQGAAIPPQRLEDVARHYEALGGKSPLNEITSRQARAVQKLLRDRGMGFSVYVGMRNAAPFFVDVLRQMARDGIERALGFILSSHHTDASWGRYQRNVADARLEIGAGAPEIDYCAGWYDHPLFIQTWCELIEEGFAGIARSQHPATPLVFTAHSVPVSMANRSSYVEELEITARSVAEKIGHENWSSRIKAAAGNRAMPGSNPTSTWSYAISRFGRYRCRRRSHRLRLRPCRGSLRSGHRSEKNSSTMRHPATPRQLSE